MWDTFAALLPVFLLIAAGRALRGGRLAGDGFWSGAERLTYYLFFPALLVTNLAEADLAGLSVLPMVAALICGMLITGLAAVWARRPLGLDGPAFTSLFQGAIRPNTYVGLAAAQALWGEAGVTLMAICLAVVVPTVNALSVTALIRHAGNGDEGAGTLLVAILKNPLILACLAGLLLNLAGGLPPLLGPLLDAVGRPALVLSLLCVGAGLDWTAARDAGRAVAKAAAFKLLLGPAVTASALAVFGVEGLTAAAATLYAGLPTSASAYILARTLGGDARLMAGIITATTLGAVFTLPLILLLVGG